MCGRHVLAGNIYVNASFCRHLALSASGFSPAPKLEKGHRFLEHLARGAVTQRLVLGFDHCQPPPPRYSLDMRSKKSRSIITRPS
jgi:hypothetical protein